MNEMKKNILLSLLLSSLITPVAQAGTWSPIEDAINLVVIAATGASLYYGYKWFATPQQKKEDYKSVDVDKELSKENLHKKSLEERAEKRYDDEKQVEDYDEKREAIEQLEKQRDQSDRVEEQRFAEKQKMQELREKSYEAYERLFALSDRFE